jgi:two-component system, OmpR family, KDP operon response regulator KdpE
MRQKNGSVLTECSLENCPQARAAHARDTKVDKIVQREHSPHRILVVEDDPILRRLNTALLIEAGYEVDTAEDGAVAWDTIQLKTFDLLITDNSMPNVTGIELLKKVRAAGIAVPIIMATAALPKDVFTQFPCLQPAATVIKPYTLEYLLGTVQNVLCGNAPVAIC